MRTILTASALAIFFLGCGARSATEPTAAAAGKASEPVPLFNGRDLSGWVQVLDSKWTVEDGVLLARQDPAGRREGESWLLTEKDYTDFILTLRFRVSPGGNSGVFLRDPIPRAERLKAVDGGVGPWEAGLEANIQADSPDWSTGSIYSIGKAPAGLERPGEWNDMKIKIQGDHVWTWVNGQPAADTQQTRTKRGAIGFQRHGTPKYRDKLVELRDIVIQEL